jgi:hypothetical protein
MYCCRHYGLSSIMSKHELSFYVLFLYVPVYIVSHVLEAPHLGRPPKQSLYKKYNIFLARLTEEYRGHVGTARGGFGPPLYSLVTCHR